MLRALFLAYLLYASAAYSIASDSASKTILIFGDSLTAGYGIDPEQAYPALIADKLATENLPYKVIPSGLSGETTAGGLRRIDWILRQPVDIFILALGANDGLRGIKLSDTRKNLEAIVAKVRSKNPQVQVILAGMRIPPNLGPEYTNEFETLYPELSESLEAALIPFLLEDVAGHPHLNLPDGIHPNPQGQAIVAQTVWRTLHPLLDK